MVVFTFFCQAPSSNLPKLLSSALEKKRHKWQQILRLIPLKESHDLCMPTLGMCTQYAHTVHAHAAHAHAANAHTMHALVIHLMLCSPRYAQYSMFIK
jgi:hypothetical protein